MLVAKFVRIALLVTKCNIVLVVKLKRQTQEKHIFVSVSESLPGNDAQYKPLRDRQVLAS